MQGSITTLDHMSSTSVSDSEKRITRPAGACSSCHRRKLKCDRTTICSNCRKAEIPCVYTPHHKRSKDIPTTRDGRKKPRGPYQKGRTVREKELEHIVEVLRAKCAVLETHSRVSSQKSLGGSLDSNEVRYGRASEASPAFEYEAGGQKQLHHPTSVQITDSRAGRGVLHPSQEQIFELWLIYTSMVDPLTKIIHCPSTWPVILTASKDTDSLDPATQAILLAVYTTSLNVLEPEDVSSRFNGQSKDTVVSLYGNELIRILVMADQQLQMNFRLLQALIMYVSCLRRQPGPGTNVKSLFSLAVRSARILGIDNPATYVGLLPLEIELRRRAWWTICRHESAYAEEVHTKSVSIMHSTDIPLPLNLEDYDLDPNMTLYPEPREGITSMSFVVIMCEIVRMVGGRLSKVIGPQSAWMDKRHDDYVKQLKEQSRLLVEATRNRIDMGTLRYCDASRPFDWFLLLITKIVLTKAEIMMLECPLEIGSMAFDYFHDIKVALSLDIIECHQLMLKEKRLKSWNWNYRNTQQWYATMYVLEEVARRPGAAFEARVWHVVDMVFANMELLKKHGMRSEDRSILLEVHSKAIEARDRWLRSGDAVAQISKRQLGVAKGGTGGKHDGIETVYGHSAMVKPQPWQIDRSLFDVPEAELAIYADDFFWPS